MEVGVFVSVMMPQWDIFILHEGGKGAGFKGERVTWKRADDSSRASL